MSDAGNGLSVQAVFVKRLFDILLSLFGIVLTWWVILIAALIARIDTGENGFFVQERVGRFGKIFKVIKIRTMRSVDGIDTTVTSDCDVRITRFGRFLRKFKIDELPQLFNVLFGQMSFVGPRPDVPGFADSLTERDKVILGVRPGITGPATIKYRDEEYLLAKQDDPELYNREVIFPDKVKINKDYVINYSFWKDIEYIVKTITG